VLDQSLVRDGDKVVAGRRSPSSAAGAGTKQQEAIRSMKSMRRKSFLKKQKRRQRQEGEEIESTIKAAEGERDIYQDQMEPSRTAEPCWFSAPQDGVVMHAARR